MNTHKTNGHLSIPSSVIRDSSLSLEEKALYAVISYYVQIPDFKLNRTYLSNHYHIGKYALKSCMDALISKSYITCEKKGHWVYCTKKVSGGYTNIPKTVLSSDLTLKEIGLYLVITYSITLPNVQMGIDLYKKYCTDCRKNILNVSKKLQLEGLYKLSKERTCKYRYELFAPENGSMVLLYCFPDLKKPNVQKKERTNVVTTTKPKTMEAKDTNLQLTSSTDLTLKELLCYDYETRDDSNDFRSGYNQAKKKLAYDLVIQAIHYAKENKYVTVNCQKMFYEKFYQNFVCKLGDPFIRAIVIKRVIYVLEQNATVHNLNLYICGIIYKTIPFATFSSFKEMHQDYEFTEALYGKEVVDQEYKSYKKSSFSYGYRDDHFYRLSGAFCA